MSSKSSVVADFLQSAVILDDRARMGPMPEEETTDTVQPPDYEGIRSSDVQHDNQSANINDQDNVYLNLDAKAVIDGFAEIGVVCSVLNPAQQENFKHRVVKTSARADIVILDWKIGDSYGDATLKVIRDILDEDEQRSRLRLLAIYTGEPDLNGIVNQVRDVIDAFYTDKPRIDNPFYLSRGPLHVVVLAKSRTKLVADAESQRVTEKDLAERLKKEFVRITQGLLQNVALAGLAALRKEAYTLLAKFDVSLDPGYLGHRILLPHPMDAEDHIVEALGYEILSILEEQRPGQAAAEKALSEWIQQARTAGLDFSTRIQNGKDPIPIVMDLLKNGVKGGDYNRLSLLWRKKVLKRCATHFFTKECDEATHANRHFSALLNLKSRYTTIVPQLTLGTILACKANDDCQYLLCLQPKCDAVRLVSKTAFPFLPLVKTQNKNRFDLVIETKTGDGNGEEWVHLELKSKPADLRMYSFKPSDNPPGEVRAQSCSEGFIFQSTDERRYRWIAEMKDEHALKIAASFSSSLARPGPNDSEWLRRRAKRH